MTTALRSFEDAADRLEDVLAGHLVAHAADGEQRGLVDDVGEVCAGEARRAVGDLVPVDVRRERLVAGVDAQDALAALTVRALDGDMPVEAAGTAQRRVEDVGTVGGADDHDAAGDVEAVHLDEQLVEGLLALVGAAARATGAALAAGGVELVDEHDGRGRGPDAREQVADTRGTDADEGLDELRTGDREERNLRLAGDGLGEKGLATSGRTEQQQALGRSGTERFVLARVLEV